MSSKRRNPPPSEKIFHSMRQTVMSAGYPWSFDGEQVDPALPCAPETLLNGYAAGASLATEGSVERMPSGWSPLPMTIMTLFVTAVFAALALTGEIGVLPAALGAILIIVVQAAVLRALHRDLDRFGSGVEELLGNLDHPEPALPSTSPTFSALWLAILRLNRLWRRRVDEVKSELASSNNVLAALPDPIILINERREVLRVNAAARELLGDNLLRRDLAVALRNPSVLKATDAVLKSGIGQMIEFDLTLQVDRHLRAGIVPLPGSPGRPDDGYAALLILNDLTALKRAEQMRADFVANASHELRTPLSTLIGFIETLQGSAHDDPKARDRFLAIMREQGRRMARLIEDLLSLSRIEQKQHVRPETIVDLAQTTRSVVDALTPMAEDLGVKIRLSAAEPVMVAGDRDELLRVAENLIENAIKYGVRADSDAAGVVEVAVSMTEKEGSLSVRDYGYGIAPEHLPRLTERFYRVDATQSRAKNSTGLGLAIVKHILTRHRGRLTITSRVNQGSSFVAMVPLQQKTKP